MATIPTSITPSKVMSTPVYVFVPNLMTSVFNVNIFGRTIVATVTSSHILFEDWISTVFPYRYNSRRHIGFEIELDEENANICTIQLCYGNRCLVFRLVQGKMSVPHCPPMLNEFLADRHNVFVGTEMILKIHWLSQQFGITEWVEYEDLDDYAPELRDVKRNLLDSLGLLDGIESDWSRPSYLSSRQIHFACIDSLLNIQIAKWVGII